MKKLFKFLLILLLANVNSKCLAQAYTTVWKLESLIEQDEKQKSLIQHINKSGFQLDQQGLAKGELILRFDNLTAISKILKKNGDKITLCSASDTLASLSRDQILQQLYTQFQEMEKGKTDIKNFSRALKGKRKISRSKNKSYAIHFGDINIPFYPYSFYFHTRNTAYAKLVFNTVVAHEYSWMPYIEYSKCSPFDRNTYFKNLSMRSYAGVIPIPYSPHQGLQKVRNFDLYFEKNKAEYRSEDLASIMKFLKDTLYAIDRAEIKAWASVEGSLEGNTILQEKRANILIQALEKYNGDSIDYTVSTEENWSLFYKQLLDKGIDSTFRSQQEWKTYLSNKDELEQWESLLAAQRKAELKLFVTVKFTDEQKHRLAFIQFNKLGSSYKFAPKEKKPSILRAMLGIRQYLDAEVSKGKLNAKELCGLYPPTSAYEYHVINFYEQANQFDKGNSKHCDFQELALTTFSIIKNCYEAKPDIKVYGDLLSIQSYLYQKIIENKLTPAAACTLFFPDEPKYHHLHLNFLKFTNALKEDPALVYKCTSESEGASFDWRTIDSDSRYYYMLKKAVLDDKKLDVVWRTDWIRECDLYEFLAYNIHHWNPDKDYFFDKEVGITEMSFYTKKLINSLDRLCPHQAYGWAIDFHAKVIQHSYLSNQKTTQLEESVQFIEGFFLKHAAELTGDQATQIVRQVLLTNAYMLRNESGRFALDLLERVQSRQGLNPEQKEFYFDLAAKLGANARIAR